MSEIQIKQSNKRLALFLDGTWNTVSDNTNIWRLRSLISSLSRDGREQRAYYSTGLGTKFGERIRGGMFGRGIDTAITGAYEWLVDNYEEGDDIFIFGFSRGAYTARSLSGFVSTCGLLKKGSPLGVNQMYKRYRRPGEPTIRSMIADADKPGTKPLDFEDKWIVKHARPVPIKFIGVFDTVGALGVPFPLLRYLKGSAYPFLNTGLRQNNEHAFHAIAIDEHRKAFGHTMWTNQGATNAAPRSIERTEQRWFVGAHANVGGGCFDDTLAQLPFEWITKKATALGLTFDGSPPEQNAIAGQVSDSYSAFMFGFYKPLTLWNRHYRSINVPPPEEGPGVKNINETIDATAFERWRTDQEYRPPGLEKWSRSKNIDPAKIMSSVRADDPSISAPD
jgi:uncharacterized protein (DUF2235 family)